MVSDGLRSRAGYKEDYLVETGLSIRRDDGSLVDRFYDRVIFPIHSVTGQVIAFGGRTLKTDKSVAKYVNSPETEIYVKNKSLYGIYFAKSEISRQDKCFLVEGYLDVLSMHQLGITNVVASSGTSLTVPQIRLIKKFTSNVTIMYDGDAAGIHAALRGIGLILKEGMNVRVVLIPDGDDPDSYSRKHTLEEMRKFLKDNEQDFITYKTDLLLGQAGNDPLKRAELINDIADTIALIPDQIKRAVYVQNAADKFGIAEDMIYARIHSSRQKMIEEERKEAERERIREESADANAVVPEVSVNADVAPSQVVPEQPVPVTSAPVGFESPVLQPSEKDLLGFILRNGMSPLEFESDSPYYEEEGAVPVADFIRDALDGHEFANTSYRRVYDEYFRLYDGDPALTQTDIVRKLMDSPDRAMADMVADFMEDRYQLTVKNFKDSMTAESSHLVLNVPKAILVYNSLRVKAQEMEITERLKELKHEEQTDDVMKEQFDLLIKLQKTAELRKSIVEKLGRVL